MDMDEKLNEIQNLLADGILTKLKMANLDSNGIKNLAEVYMMLYRANIKEDI